MKIFFTVMILINGYSVAGALWNDHDPEHLFPQAFSPIPALFFILVALFWVWGVKFDSKEK